MNQLNYFVIDAIGKVLKRGICHESTIQSQAGEGQAVIVGECPPNHDIDMVTGEFVARESPQPAEPTYREKRAENYPPIVDQLDALWHAMDDGLIPKAPAFFDAIAAVKQQYPKQ